MDPEGAEQEKPVSGGPRLYDSIYMKRPKETTHGDRERIRACAGLADGEAQRGHCWCRISFQDGEKILKL